MITIQYLEPGPHIGDIPISQAHAKLQAAFEYLPIDCLLLGWEIPSTLEDICQDVFLKVYESYPWNLGTVQE